MSLHPPQLKDRSLYIDASLLPRDLMDQLHEKPEDAFYYLIPVLTEKGYYKDSLTVRFTGFPKEYGIKELNADRIGQFVKLKGIVRKVKSVKPIITKAYFRCNNDIHSSLEPQESRRLKVPDIPCDCRNGKWRLDIKKSVTEDFQLLEIQEPPDSLRGGDAPGAIEVEVYGDITGLVTAGNKVTVNGILRTRLIKDEP